MADQQFFPNQQYLPNVNNTTTLTDHFKQALNMTRNQMQNGPSALSSASQIGLNVPHTNPAMMTTNHQIPTQTTNLPLLSRPLADMPFGAREALMNEMNAHSSEESGSFLQKYGKWIFLIVVIIAGIGFWIWWKKRQNGNDSNSEENMIVRQRRPLNRPGMGGNNNNNNAPPSMAELSGMGPNFAEMYGSRLVHSPQEDMNYGGVPHKDNYGVPPTVTQFQSKQSMREIENKSIDNRGAELSNPSFISSMRPINTRLDTSPSASQVSTMPPQNNPQSMLRPSTNPQQQVPQYPPQQQVPQYPPQQQAPQYPPQQQAPQYPPQQQAPQYPPQQVPQQVPQYPPQQQAPQYPPQQQPPQQVPNLPLQQPQQLEGSGSLNPTTIPNDPNLTPI